MKAKLITKLKIKIFYNVYFINGHSVISQET